MSSHFPPLFLLFFALKNIASIKINGSRKFSPNLFRKNFLKKLCELRRHDERHSSFFY